MTACLGSRGPEAWVSDDLFQDVCVATDLGGQRDCLPLEQGAGLFTVQCNKEDVLLLAKVGLLKLRALPLRGTASVRHLSGWAHTGSRGQGEPIRM